MAPRSGRIHKEYELPFAEWGLDRSLRDINQEQEFSAVREEILTMIWNMEEEIMGVVLDWLSDNRAIVAAIIILLLFGAFLFGLFYLALGKHAYEKRIRFLVIQSVLLVAGFGRFAVSQCSCLPGSIFHGGCARLFPACGK